MRSQVPRLALLVAVAATVAQALVLWFGLRHEWFANILTVECVAVGLFALALAAVWYYGRTAAPKRVLLLVLVGGALLQVAALGSPPSSSDDVYRYVWDAKVQLAGTDPYRYTPDAPQLDRLRGTFLFYQGKSTCPWKLPSGECSRVNRPSVHTIYPPVAEGAFVLARLGSGGSTDGPFPLQVMAAIGTVLLSLLLAGWAYARGKPAWWVAVWSWCPIASVELANNGHIDWLAALATAAALMAYERRRSVLAGGLLGAAIATKLFPALIVPAMLRRHPVRVCAAAAGLVVLGYLPHVAAVGTDVIGYLPGYLKEEDYTNGGRFLLLYKVIPHSLLTPVAVLILLGVALLAARRTREDRPEEWALIMVGVFMLVSTPSYSWYLVLLLVLVAMTGRVEWLPLVVAPTVANLGATYFGTGVEYRTTCYAVGLLAAVVGVAAREIVVSRRPVTL